MAPGGVESYQYLPVISSGPQSEPERLVQSIYGLAGTIRPGIGASGEQIVVPGGRAYTLVAATPALDRRLMALAAQRPAASIKVWGTLYTTGADPDAAFIVVSDVVEAEMAPPPSTPSPTPRGAVAIGRFDGVNLRSEPEAQAARSGQIRLNQRCALVGRNPASTWILLECPGGVRGWIEPRLVAVSGDFAGVPIVSAVAVAPPTATPAPTPVPTPRPYTFQGWRALFYDNAQMRGVPVAVQDVPALDLNWGSGPLYPGLPADYTSASFERRVNLNPGFYLFTAEADDGLRFLIDDVVVLDQWTNASGQVYRFGQSLAGAHDLRVEYNEVSGMARLRVDLRSSTSTSWQASYSGLPNVPGGTLSQGEPDGGQFRLDYNWGAGSPTGSPAANWMARWVGRYSFGEGNYVFFAHGEDGIRVSIDGQVIINKWTDGYGQVANRFYGVGQGEHLITVDYFNRQGTARVRVSWYPDPPAGSVPQ